MSNNLICDEYLRKFSCTLTMEKFIRALAKLILFNTNYPNKLCTILIQQIQQTHYPRFFLITQVVHFFKYVFFNLCSFDIAHTLKRFLKHEVTIFILHQARKLRKVEKFLDPELFGILTLKSFLHGQSYQDTFRLRLKQTSASTVKSSFDKLP